MVDDVNNEPNEQTALVPISEALPQLRASEFAQVRAWDAARMALSSDYEAADGEYLRKIRDALKPLKLWTRYLEAREIPYATASQRIRQAEGRFVRTLRQPMHDIDLHNVTPPVAPHITVREAEVPPVSWQPTAPSAWDDEPADALWAEEHVRDSAPMPEVATWPPEVDEPSEPTTPLWQPPTSRPAPVIVPTVPSVVTYSVDEWNALDSGKRAAIVANGRENKASLNQQDTDSIEWARWSWNPVTGCLHDCPYCYARDIANRFYPQGFRPTFHPLRLGAPAHQHVPAQAEHELGYRNIFTCSMADLFGKWVPAEWIEAVLEVARDNPQWNFLFLTKFPNRLAEFTYPQNAWLGTSVDCQARVKNAERAFSRVQGGIKWLSVEPMLEPLRFTSLEMFDWVVIGGASKSNETPEWQPPLRWVRDLEAAARAANCMVYEKTNLGAREREYPGWERPEPTLPDALKYLPSISQEG